MVPPSRGISTIRNVLDTIKVNLCIKQNFFFPLPIDTSGTNSSVDWDWKYLNIYLAMACGVTVSNSYIYFIGGFNRMSKVISNYTGFF